MPKNDLFLVGTTGGDEKERFYDKNIVCLILYF